MTELETVHADYVQKKAAVQKINLDIETVSHEIESLSTKITEAQQSALEIHERLDNSAQDVVSGKLSTSDVLQLKQSITEKEVLIKSLEEVITVHISAKKSLIDNNKPRLLKIKEGGFPKIEDAQHKLAKAKNELNKALLKQATDQLGTTSPKEIKQFITQLASNEKYTRLSGKLEGNIYNDIGEALCKAIFSDIDFPTFEQARKEQEVMIEALS